VQTAVQPLAKLLADLSRELPAAKINLLAHSMGNRALLRALDELSAHDSSPCRFHNVVLAAPDVGIDEFPALAKAARRISERVTLYASDRDKALMLSEQAHGVARAGDASHLTLVEGVDAIDVSSVGLSFLGHSYYGSNRSVLSDMYELLKLNTPLSERTWLATSVRNGHKCWRFVGKPPEVVRIQNSQTRR